MLSAIFDFLFFLHSAQIHSLIAQNLIYKIKSYFP